LCRPECHDQAVNFECIHAGLNRRKRFKRGHVGSSQSDVGRARRFILPQLSC